MSWAFGGLMLGSLGGSAGPMFGLCWAKRCRHLGLCSANFNPDLRKIRSGLRKTILFGPCPSHIGPILCQVGACWAYLAILQQLAHPLLELHVTILHCIKLNLTWRIFLLKMRLSSNMQIYQWTILFGWANQQGMETQSNIYIYILYSFICLFI